MKCSPCGFENEAGKKFCTACGARLVARCPECHTEIMETENYCGECGHDLREPEVRPPVDYLQPQTYTPKFLANKILKNRSAIEGERKLVTVLFADVANYTSLAEKLDPEEVHQIMDGCFSILMDEIHRYEGTINQFTGDGVMALFGAPVAHEDHAQRACYASLSIQRAVRGYGEKLHREKGIEFAMRIGLNSGPVVVGAIGDDLRMDYTAIGDTTNLANRMQDRAEPGSVLVSKHTHRLVSEFFAFHPEGKVEVKGKEVAQEAYELLRPTKVETRIGAATVKGLTRFVGRVKEMKILKEAFEEARSGSGQVIGIVGEAGVGKSRLLIEFRGLLPENEYTFLEGKCLHYGDSMPYLPVLDVLKAYFKVEEESREIEIKKRIGEQLARLDEKLLGNLPSFHDLLSLPVEDEKHLQLDPQQRRMMSFEAIRNLLIRISQEKPLLIAMEDLHWIDKTSEEFLEYLIGSLPSSSILLILLYRPEYTHTWGNRSCYRKIGLDQLSSDRSSELVQAILKEDDVASEVKDLILGRAGGNPLFVEELAYSLLENGSIHMRGNKYALSKNASSIEVPDTIQAIIASRIDRVEVNLKRLMQVASVIGREFAYRILATITEMKEDLKPSLVHLQDLEFIYESQIFPELEYIFKHALIQEVSYNSLLLKRKKIIHEKIGRAIEELYADRIEECYELLAYHYVRSANKEKALKYLDLANQKAAKASAMGDAKAYFEKSMEILDALEENEESRERRISLLANQSIVFLLLFKMPEYHDLLTRYEGTASAVQNTGLLGRFYARLGHCEYVFGHFEKAVVTLTKAAELSEASGNPEEMRFAYCMLKWCFLFRGEIERVLSLGERTIVNRGGKFNLQTQVRSLCVISGAYTSSGRWREAVEFGEEALRIAKEYSDSSHIAFAGWTLCHAYACKGDLARSIEYGELSVQKAPTPYDKAFANLYLAEAWNRAGEPHRGIDGLATIVPIVRAARFVPAELLAVPVLAEAYWLAGECVKARETAEELLAVAERHGARGQAGQAHRILGQAEQSSHPEQAAFHFQQSIDILREVGAENEMALSLASYGRFRKQQSNIDQARELLSKALEIFERLGTLIEPGRVRKELAELP